MFRKIVDFCVKNGFLKVQDYPNTSLFELKVGPSGALLMGNLKQEWLDNFINSKDVPVFHNHEDFKATFEYSKELLFGTVPFGIVELSPLKKKFFINVENNILSNNNGDFSDYFLNDVKLLYTNFIAPSVAQQTFHQIQRQRKIWWRKISASPGRYNLSDITTGIDPNSSVKIQAKHDWGNQVLESVNLHLKNYPGLTNADLMVRDGKKQVPAVFIQCETKLSHLFLNCLCDAYEEPIFHEQIRPLLRFHRKIAAYKIGFSLTYSRNETLNDLQDLSLYLCKLLRNSYITTLLIPANVKKTLEAQYRQYDELGIPYTIFLNETTLKDGIAWLRSRDTTLKEQVHVSDLVPYVEKIFKNF